MTRLRTLVLLLLSAPAFAQSEADEQPDTPPRRVIYQAETQIDFDALGIDAELVKPTLTYGADRVAGRFNPLIRIRQDFAPEMLDTTQEVR